MATSLQESEKEVWMDKIHTNTFHLVKKNSWSLSWSFSMLYNCLEWYKWVLTNLYHDRQLYNTLIPPSHESPAVGLQTCTCPWLTHCTYFTLEWIRELTLRYTTPDIHCRHRRHECDGGINGINELLKFFVSQYTVEKIDIPVSKSSQQCRDTEDCNDRRQYFTSLRPLWSIVY